MADWKLSGTLIAACSCDWGCPCSFDARPTQGFCEGGYAWIVSQGEYEGVKLDGLAFALLGHAPGPLHEGNVTFCTIVEERTTGEQRAAILELCSGKHGGPWTIFAAVTGKNLDPVYAPFTVKVKGLNSSVHAGDVFHADLDFIHNPVTGVAEQLQLRKPTGFTSLWADLGSTRSFRVNVPGLQYDHSGKYGEYAEFSYTP